MALCIYMSKAMNPASVSYRADFQQHRTYPGDPLVIITLSMVATTPAQLPAQPCLYLNFIQTFVKPYSIGLIFTVSAFTSIPVCGCDLCALIPVLCLASL